MIKGLPTFPEFEKLSLTHKDILRSIVYNFPSSDFNFSGLFTWDTTDSVMVSALNDNLVVRSSDYLTHSKFYSFIGDNKVDETIKTIIDHANSQGEDTKLRLITEKVASNITRDKHLISEDRDNHDYIYLVRDWVELKGKNYRGKRNLLHNFQRKYGVSVKEKELDLTDESIRNEIERVMEKWQQARGKNSTEVRDEFKGIRKALEHHDALDIKAFGIYHSNELIAFLLFEVLPNKVAIGHFEKADTIFEGVFVHLRHTLAKHLASMDIETFNTEQDLGVEGLRKSKESYHPHEFIKKYTVERIKD